MSPPCTQYALFSWLVITCFSYNSPPVRGTYWQIEGFHCHYDYPSLPCFTYCWNTDNITKVEQCSEGYEFIYPTCGKLKYDYIAKLICSIVYAEVNASVFGAGNRELCQYETGLK